MPVRRGVRAVCAAVAAACLLGTRKSAFVPGAHSSELRQLHAPGVRPAAASFKSARSDSGLTTAGAMVGAALLALGVKRQTKVEMHNQLVDEGPVEPGMKEFGFTTESPELKDIWFDSYGNQIRVRKQRLRQSTKSWRPVPWKMHVKPGDVVQITHGGEAGKVTKILKTYPNWNQVLCANVNLVTKNIRAERDDERGYQIKVEKAIHASNVMHYDEEMGVAGLLGIRYEDGATGPRKVRYNKATGNEIPDRKPPEWIAYEKRLEGGVFPDEVEEDDEE